MAPQIRSEPELPSIVLPLTLQDFIIAFRGTLPNSMAILSFSSY